MIILWFISFDSSGQRMLEDNFVAATVTVRGMLGSYQKIDL